MKKFTLLLFTVVGITILNAKPVSPDAAKLVAQKFYNNIAGVEIKTISLNYTETNSTGYPVFYVFDINTNGGFVIINADDAARPVLGYSTKGKFVNPLPSSNMGSWLQWRKSEVAALRKNNSIATAEITNEWLNPAVSKNLQRTERNISVDPLLTTTWDQTHYYNDSCPSGSLTGCVATAMAQIMRFWNYPSSGTGSSSYCDCTSQGFQQNFGILSANYSASTYNWANMPDSLTSANKDVAMLMKQCGISVQMNYSPTNSGAYVFAADPSTICAQNAFINYFKYNPDSIFGVSRDVLYDDQLWIDMLKNELDKGRPIQYVAYDYYYGGHTWVCDGYDEFDNLHMNWGWGGVNDGYYDIWDLMPGPVLDFSYENAALMGIQPIGATITGITNVKPVEDFTVYPNPANASITISGGRYKGLVNFTMFDLSGRCVKNGTFVTGNTDFKMNLAVNDLSPGMYLLKVSDAKNAGVKKILIQ